MTNLSIDDIKNTNLFKYSPYNTLTNEQNEVCKNIIYDIIEKISNKIDGTSIIMGGAGTGKTIVLINMIFKLVNANKIEIDFSEENDILTDNNKLIHDLKEFLKNNERELKIGYIVPMTSIRKTLKIVFDETGNGLKSSMVIGPFDVFTDTYDIVFVDEAHRLTHYKNIGYMGEYKKHAIELGKQPEEVTQLDMIVAKSKYRVLVYDRNQTVKGSDITNKEFESAISKSAVSKYLLSSQMRCEGGTKYTEYLDNIFNCSQKEFLKMDNYDFNIFDDVDEMVQNIKKLDKKLGLCRNAAGYSWEWVSKIDKNKKALGIKTYDDIINNHLEDIHIGKYKYVWNMTNQEFILSNNAINEIGCVHTLQGYDLNYIGVIFGNEIDYNFKTNELEVNLDKFFDKYVKQGMQENEVKHFIINSYKVIMSRGIKGCYVYACNKNMRDYLTRFISKWEE